jgi:hypothetical protein
VLHCCRKRQAGIQWRLARRWTNDGNGGLSILRPFILLFAFQVFIGVTHSSFDAQASARQLLNPYSTILKQNLIWLLVNGHMIICAATDLWATDDTCQTIEYSISVPAAAFRTLAARRYCLLECV